MNLPLSVEELKNAVDQFGTPLYIYDESSLNERCNKLRQLFSGLPVSWLYAMKANDNPHLLEIISQNRFGLDTVSYEEVLLGLGFTRTPTDIFYTENNMTDTEMDQAIASGVVLNIGSYSRLEAFCRHPEAKSCCIRINPAIGDGHHEKVDTGNSESKFGIRKDLIEDCFRLADRHNIRIEGLHVHIGSGIKDPSNMYEAINMMLNLANGYESLEYINFGGGLPVSYHPGDEEFDLQEFEYITRPLLESFLNKKNGNFRFYFEPGRWIIAPAGLLLTSVNTVKDQGNKTFLGTDTGFHHLLRPALYDAYHHIVNISRLDQAEDTRYDIAGNICESGDLIGINRDLPESEIGDLLAILNSGAYGMTMASHYNRRALPAEVLKTESGEFKLIRDRLSPEEQVRKHLDECKYPDFIESIADNKWDY